jgi:hypothetical protein
LNSVHRSFLTVLFAPLAGVILYLLLIDQFEIGYPTSDLLFLIAVAWFVALLITAMIGIPIGLGIAHYLRKFGLESVWMYGAIGFVVAAILPAIVGWSELIAPAALVGCVLGLGYWQFEAKPRLADD